MSSKHRRLLLDRRSLNGERRLSCLLLRLPTCLLPSVTGMMGILRSRAARLQGAIPPMAVIPCPVGQGTAASRRMVASPPTAVTRLMVADLPMAAEAGAGAGAARNPVVVVTSILILALAPQAPAHRVLQSKSSALLVDPDIDHVLLRPTRRSSSKTP